MIVMLFRTRGFGVCAKVASQVEFICSTPHPWPVLLPIMTKQKVDREDKIAAESTMYSKTKEIISGLECEFDHVLYMM